MSPLRQWLRERQLDALAETLEANDIDLDILADLGDGDLAQIGLSLGNRRRLMKAIAAPARTEATPPSRPEPPPAPAPEPSGEAERRQVTVLFCDLVGSTALSRAIDPELLGALLRRYQDAAAGAIARYDGFLAKFMGDGVLAYFGFPRAFEDAAERAVRAALGLVAEIGLIEGSGGVRLQARIGIATGLVVVGEIVGTGAAQERSIVGETPNLAARLQGLASPDAILISEATQHLLGGVFELEALGAREMKGFLQPVPVWRVRGEATIESRYAASRAGATPPLVGRAHEMGLMLDRWRRARQGEGQIITMIGEAGIGKSRAVEALQEKLADDPHRRVHLQCSPYYVDSALYPVIRHVARTAGFAAEDSPDEKRAKLATLFTERIARDPTALPLLASLMSLPSPAPDAELPPATPAQHKEATIALLVDELVRLGAAEPVLLILEDGHWVDATTLLLMTRLVDGIAEARLLAIVTARPDFVAPWATRPQATLLSFGRLSRADSAALVAGVAAARGLSAETIETIIAKTDGVPLFVEELTKSVLETAGDDGAAVPATLKDSLMARLDRLGMAREVAQIAAVIGRQFAEGLLDAVTRGGAVDVPAALARLVAAGIVFPQGRSQERVYSFKHALVRDAAYDSLLLARRREWHERIARALETGFPEIVAAEPELLAHHFGAAGLAEPACHYRMRAGDSAAARSAYHEAIAHYSAGIALAESLPDASDRQHSQLNFLLKLGPAFTVTRGAQSAEAGEVFRRAAEIGEALNDDLATYKSKWGLWLNANLSRKTAQARDRAKELVALAHRSGDADLLLEAHHCGWSTAYFRGEVAAALQMSRLGLDAYDIDRHRHLGPAFGGHDPGVCGHVVRGNALMLGAAPEEAAAAIERGYALATALDHPFNLAHASYNAATAYQLAGDRDATMAWVERTIALAEKYGFAPYRMGAILTGGWAELSPQRYAPQVALVETELERAVAVGSSAQHLFGLAGEVMMVAGRHADAIALLDRGIAANDEPGVGYYLAEIHRLRGRCLLALDRGNLEAARAAFAAAREIAHRQGAILLERRAEAALAGLSLK
jgi:class 3 adenylate cyclase/tetratricopeptide (TPR) repeat protein